MRLLSLEIQFGCNVLVADVPDAYFRSRQSEHGKRRGVKKKRCGAQSYRVNRPLSNRQRDFREHLNTRVRVTPRGRLTK